jgi:hypothetical protein
MAAILSVILKLPPAKQALASRQMRSTGCSAPRRERRRREPRRAPLSVLPGSPSSAPSGIVPGRRTPACISVPDGSTALDWRTEQPRGDVVEEGKTRPHPPRRRTKGERQ